MKGRVSCLISASESHRSGIQCVQFTQFKGILQFSCLTVNISQTNTETFI